MLPQHILHGKVSSGTLPLHILHGEMPSGTLPEHILHGKMPSGTLPEHILHGKRLPEYFQNTFCVEKCIRGQIIITIN